MQCLLSTTYKFKYFSPVFHSHCHISYRFHCIPDFRGRSDNYFVKIQIDINEEIVKFVDVIRMKKGDWILLGLMLVSVVVGMVTGPFPVGAFAFPVGAAILLACLAGLWVLYREKPDCAFCRYLSSGHTSIFVIANLVVCFIVLGLNKQSDPQSVPGGHTLADLLCIHSVKNSWWFVCAICLFLANLAMVIFRRLTRSSWRFVLNHLGLFIALSAGFFGSADESVLRCIVGKGETVTSGFDRYGMERALGHSLCLEEFSISLRPDGSPRNFEAEVSVDGKPVEIMVNNPYAAGFGKDVYLVDYDKNSENVCVFEIVSQPWKYLEWAGIVMMMVGAVLMFLQGAAKRKER